ncbi:MAG: sigma-E processing peptidase SpoIIGA [Oscillospiraceae bacterium]|nr:sigma-E processing peptidase SpoIIGA [Oscillospiraceae bacterium]
MAQVIYIDELVFINIVVNYFLILSGALIAGAEFSRPRILLGAALGGAGSLIIFVPGMRVWLSVFVKVALSAIIVLCSFKIRLILQFLRLYGAFFLVNFIFAGLMLALSFLMPNSMVYNNGAVYFNIRVGTLIALTVICYLVISGVSALIRRRAPATHFGKAEITVGDLRVSGPAMFDTGNHLTDSFTGRPVIITEYALVKPLIPPQLHGFFRENRLTEDEIASGWDGRIRVIPFSAVNHRGLLPAFRCDKLKVECGGQYCERADIFVGVTDERLSNGEYSLLLNGSLFDELESGGKIHESALKGSVARRENKA